MPLTLIYTAPGDFANIDNGVPGDNTSHITDGNGVVIFTFLHPADALTMRVSTPDVHISFDYLDGFGAANVTYGNILDPAQTMESLRVGALVTTGIVTLVANNGINEFGSDPGADVRAGTLLFSAGTGVGATGAIEFLAGTLEAETTTGGIDLRAFGNVFIGGGSDEIRGLEVLTTGNAKLVANGTITLNEASPGALESVKAGNTNGNVTLTALGFSSSIVANTDLDAVTAPRGQIVLEAGLDVLLGTSGTDFDNDVRANDSLKITAGRDVIISGFADLASDAFFQNTGEGVTIIAGRDIRLTDDFGSDGSITASGSAGGDVRLTAGFGGFVRLTASTPTAVSSNSGDVLVEADRFEVSASSGINAGAGSVTIRPRSEGWRIDLGSAIDATASTLEISDAELDRLFTNSVTIGGEQAGDVTVSSSISPGGATAVTLRSGSKVQVNAFVNVTVDSITFRSGGDIAILAGAAFFTSGPLVGFVDDDGADGGIGGKALVAAALATSVNFTGADDNDTLQGGATADTLNGGAGVDSMAGRNGNDTYIATAGDIITEVVGEGEDLVQSSSNWILGAFLENLTLTGAGNRDGTGNELDNKINGNGGDNVLDGADGADTINGFAGQDTLNGGADKDRLNGGGNKDVINGGGKNDKLEGGADDDRFRFDTTPSTTQNNDEIIDYVVADDTVELENAVFTSLTTLGLLPANQFVSGAAAADGNDFIIHNSATGAILYDPDGNGATPAIQFASVTPGLVLSRFDFFVT